jgi:hypothetical protein
MCAVGGLADVGMNYGNGQHTIWSSMAYEKVESKFLKHLNQQCPAFLLIGQNFLTKKPWGQKNISKPSCWAKSVLFTPILSH